MIAIDNRLIRVPLKKVEVVKYVGKNLKKSNEEWFLFKSKHN